MSARSRIYLAGLSGAGKSTVATLLARWLNTRSGDVDVEVERATGRPIAALWRAEGEPAFRRAEREAVAHLLRQDGMRVIALGGGTLEDPESRERLARWGTGIWLDAPASALAARIEDDRGRPLVAGTDPTRALAALAVARRPRFETLPVRVSAESENAAAVAVAVLRALAAAGIAPDGAAGMGIERLAPGVRFGRGSLAAVGELLPQSAAPLAVVTDATVWALHGPALSERLAAAGGEAWPIVLPEGEAAKSIAHLAAVWRALLAHEAARDTALAVLGGGALGDVAGLAAATFKRGLPLALFPTTLLAQVDAAIGGKNAIDLDGVKNAAGTFHDPSIVAIDPLSPLTQPDRDWRAGWAEVVKSALVGDAELFDLCEREPEAIRDRRLVVVEEAIRRAAAVKLQVVAADPRDSGPRRVLNLGHTLGHALESAADGGLVHGEAVAIGLVAAARLADREGIAEAGLADRTESALTALGLPVRPPGGIDPERVLALVGQDKKRAAGALHVVLPLRPGAVEVRALDAAAVERWIRDALAAAAPVGSAP